MVLLLLLKPAAQAQAGRTKLFINCLSNPTSTCTHESGPAGNTLQIGTVYTFQTLMDSCSRRSGTSNSGRSRWKLTEQTTIWVQINLVQHTKCSNMTSMVQRQESLIRARIHLMLEKLKTTCSSRPPQTRTILKDFKILLWRGHGPGGLYFTVSCDAVKSQLIKDYKM